MSDRRRGRFGAWAVVAAMLAGVGFVAVSPGTGSADDGDDTTSTIEADPTTSTIEADPTTSTIELDTTTTSVVADTTTTTTEVADTTTTTTTTTAPELPAAPVVVATPGNQRVDISWSVPAPGSGAIVDYVIERRVAGGSPTTVADGDSTGTVFTDTGLAGGTVYSYRVAAVSDVGTGAYSVPVTATPFARPSASPSLTAVAGVGRVTLTWGAAPPNGATVAGYIVQRSTTSATGFVNVANLAGTARSYPVTTGMSAGTRYYFRVIARNTAGDGPASTAVGAVPYAVPSVPPSVAVAVGNGRATVRWGAATPNGSTVDRYTVQRSLSPTSGFVAIANTVPTARSFVATGLTNGRRYYFRVLAHNAAGNGSVSAAASVVPFPAPGTPSTPKAVAGVGRTTLSWGAATSVGTPVDSYTVQRSTSATTGFVDVARLGSTVRSYVATGLSGGRRYYFRIVAHSAGGYGTPSVVVSAVPYTAPSAPGGVVATAGIRSARLTWQASANNGANVDRYTVQRSTSPTSGFVTIANVGPTVRSYSAAALNGGSRYYFRVIAHNAAGNGSSSAVVNAVPIAPPTAPRSVSAAASSGSVTVRWVAPASTGGRPITSYVVQRSASGGAWSNVATVTGTSFTVTASNSVRYQFRVIARNAAGSSPASAAVSTLYFANCTAVRAAGMAPLYRGQLGYRPALDGDNNGVACQ